MTNGYYSITNYQPANDSLPELASSYSISYQGPHIGFKTQKKLTANLALIGTLSYTPLAFVDGRGWWNLRDLSFTHTGPGQMFDGSLALCFSPAGGRSSLELGYRYQHFSLVHPGYESTSSLISWDEATNIQQGPYISGVITF